MVYFIKVTEQGNGIVVGEKKLSTKLVNINGVEREVRTQGGRLGFIAWQNAAECNCEKGQPLPFNLTDKPVRTKDKEVIPNLFWCDPA